MTSPDLASKFPKEHKKPNFGLIVFLSAVALIVIFICAYIALRGDGKKMLPKIHDNHPTSQMMPFRAPSPEPIAPGLTAPGPNASLC